MSAAQTFAVTWDYRCPFARNGHEHVLDGLEAGAPWDVTFVPFFLNQTHVPEGGTPAWEDPAHQPDLLALAAGVVVRDRFPERLPPVHRSLFTARHDEGGDLRDRPWCARRARTGRRRRRRGAGRGRGRMAGQDGPRGARASGRAELHVFGVPTFIVGDRARCSSGS